MTKEEMAQKAHQLAIAIAPPPGTPVVPARIQHPFKLTEFEMLRNRVIALEAKVAELLEKQK